MPVAACKRSGKSPHSAADPSPSCSITMVGASDGCGPIRRYSRSLSLTRRRPEGASVMTFSSVIPDRARSGLIRNLDVVLSGSRFRVRCVASPRNDEHSYVVFPQLETLDLAGCGFRQGFDGLDPARIFPDADLLLDVVLQRLVETSLVRLGAQHHERFRLEQAFAVRLG